MDKNFDDIEYMLNKYRRNVQAPEGLAERIIMQSASMPQTGLSSPQERQASFGQFVKGFFESFEEILEETFVGPRPVLAMAVIILLGVATSYVLHTQFKETEL